MQEVQEKYQEAKDLIDKYKDSSYEELIGKAQEEYNKAKDYIDNKYKEAQEEYNKAKYFIDNFDLSNEINNLLKDNLSATGFSNYLQGQINLEDLGIDIGDANLTQALEEILDDCIDKGTNAVTSYIKGESSSIDTAAEGGGESFVDWEAAGSYALSLLTQKILRGFDLGDDPISNEIERSIISWAQGGFNDFDFNPATAAAGYIGKQLADSVLNYNSAEEAIGASIGSSLGTALGGSTPLGPIGAMIGSYIGAAIGDTLGETWNNLSELAEDFEVTDISDWGALASELLGTVVNFASALLGNDEEAEASINLAFNPDTGLYEEIGRYQINGGEVTNIEKASDGITEQISKILEVLEQGGQLANGREMPSISVGYKGEDSFIDLEGIGRFGLNAQGIENTIGAVLKSMEIEGGNKYVNRLLYSDDVEATQITSLIGHASKRKYYDEDQELQQQIDKLIEDKQTEIEKYQQLEQEIPTLESSLEKLIKPFPPRFSNEISEYELEQYKEKLAAYKLEKKTLEDELASKQDEKNQLLNEEEVERLQTQIKDKRVEITTALEGNKERLTENYKQAQQRYFLEQIKQQDPKQYRQILIQAIATTKDELTTTDDEQATTNIAGGSDFLPISSKIDIDMGVTGEAVNDKLFRRAV